MRVRSCAHLWRLILLKNGNASDRVLFFHVATMAYTTEKSEGEIPLSAGKNFEKPFPWLRLSRVETVDRSG